MNILDPRRLVWFALAAAPLWACGDDDEPSDDNTTAGQTAAGQGGSGATAGKAAGGGGSGGKATGGGGASAGQGGEPVVDGGEGGTPNPGGGAGGEGGFGEGGTDPGTAGAGGEGGTPPSPYPSVPSVLSLSGCTGVGPLCSVTQDEGEFTANCGGRLFEGEIGENGAFTMDGENVTATNGSVTSTTCTGQVRPTGVTATCSNTVTPAGGTATTTECTLVVDPVILPGISCLELPKKLDNFVLDPQVGTSANITLGTANVIQDGCNFQAQFPNNSVITGTVTKTGFSFTRALTALADAQTPNPTTQNPNPTPAFLAGATVNHSCSVTISGASVETGTCSAGNVGGQAPKPATSVYAITFGVSEPPPVCGALGPFREDLFVLNSCTILKEGEGGVPGIGEPICAFQQNGCVWQVTCITEEAGNLVFAGKLEPGQTKAEWRFTTGTPCEASFDSAGNLSGKCTVPGQAACTLSSKPPAPAVGCPQLPSTDFFSYGCGNDTDSMPLDCRVTLQHGCNFAAICDFSASRFPDYVFAGKTSTEGSVDYMKFPGLSGRQCTVQRATAEEIADPSQCRGPGEWYGDCLTPTGNGCSNTFQCVADSEGNYPAPGSNIRRGLRLWFD